MNAGQIPGPQLGSVPMHQKTAMVMEDDDPSIKEAEAGEASGNETYDTANVRVKTAERQLAHELS